MSQRRRRPTAARGCTWQVLEPRRLLAAQLAADINTATASSSPGFVAALPNAALFATTTGSSRSLWRTDGTSSGTQLVKSGISLSGTSAVVGETLFFTADAFDRHGTELWKSDGTAEGTVRVKDLNPGAPSGNYSNFYSGGGRLYFTAPVDPNSPNGEVWISDGTDAGTHVLKDISHGEYATQPSGFTFWNGSVYFTAYTPDAGQELWKTDGTEAGTVLAQDIVPGPASSNIGDLTVVNGSLYGVASTESGGARRIFLVTADDSLRPVTDSAVVNGPTNLVALGSTLFFAGFSTQGGYGLYKSEGTPQTTRLITEFQSMPAQLQALDSKLLLLAYGGDFIQHLWTTDGTGAGTEALNVPNITKFPGALVRCGSRVYFYGQGSDLKGRLGFTDGTQAGTGLVQTAPPMQPFYPAADPFVFKDRLLINASTASCGAEPFVSDGTDAGTRMLLDIEQATNSSSPDRITPVGSSVYFRAISNTYGSELFRAERGVVSLVKDIVAGAGSSSPDLMTDVAGKCFFVANDGARNCLFVSEGTDATTVKLNSTLNNYTNFVAVGTKLYFIAQSGIQYGIYESNGTVSGTKLVATMAGTPSTTALANMIYFNRQLYFRWSGTGGTKLWKSDLTQAGTSVVKDSGSAATNPDKFTVIGGALFFIASSTAAGTELWKLESPDVGTVLVKDIYPGAGSSTPSYLMPFKSKLFFAATGAEGSELWSSDGTSTGTMLLKDISTGAGSSTPRNLTVLHDLLLFEASDIGTRNNELWRSDGTTAGTSLVKRAGVLGVGSNPQQFCVAGDRLFYQCSAPEGYAYLWSSDGTETGTFLVDRLNTPRLLTSADGFLYFTTTAAQYGNELWKLDATRPFVTADGVLSINGTSGSDTIEITYADGQITTHVNGAVSTTPIAGVSRIALSAFGGTDSLSVGEVPVLIDYSGGKRFTLLEIKSPKRFTFPKGRGTVVVDQLKLSPDASLDLND
ncbi:MAG TPA: ELWxxDGT repeat protein, partial [Tepidisphaeraceae bacterium]